MALKVYMQLKVESSPAGIAGFTDITPRVALEKASWSQDADGMSSSIRFPIFTILPQSELDWSEYPGATNEIKFAAAVADQYYRIDIPIRAEFYIEETTTGKRIFGGVITAVDYGQESGYIVADITGGDYTQILEEWVVNRYDIPYASKDTDIIVGNITPNAYTGVATPSIFNSANLARNIDRKEGEAYESPSINPIFYTITNIEKSGPGSYSASAVSSIVTTEEDHDFEVGQQAIISGTVLIASTQSNEVFDCTATVTHVLSDKIFVVASFPVSPSSVVSDATGTDYPQSTAIVRHDYITSASDTLFSPVYAGYGTEFDIEKLSRSSGSGKISVEASAPATATIEMVPGDGYYYAVKSITKDVTPYTNITSENLAVAVIDPNPVDGGGRTDSSQMSLRRTIEQVTKKGDTIEITLQAGTYLEARPDTLCYIQAYLFKKKGKKNDPAATKDINGIYKVVALGSANNSFTVTPVTASITGLADQTWITTNVNLGKGAQQKTGTEVVTVKGKKKTVNTYYTPGNGKSPLVDAGVAIASGDNWVISGDKPDAGITATAVVPTKSALSVSGISRARTVSVGGSSYIEYFAASGTSFASFAASDYVDVSSYASNYVFSDAIVSAVNPVGTFTAATAKTTEVIANNISQIVAISTGQIKVFYDDTNPGFISGDFVQIYDLTPGDYTTTFARIAAYGSEEKAISGYVQAKSVVSISSFDSGKIVSVDSAKSINSVEMFYDESGSEIAVNDYVSISSGSVTNSTSGLPISIASTAARVVGVNKTNVVVSGAVAKTGIATITGKLHAVTEIKGSTGVEGRYLRYFFDPGTTLGVAVNDIVSISGVVDSLGRPFSYYNRTNVQVVEIGSTTFGGGGNPAVSPPGTYPYIRIFKPTTGSGDSVKYTGMPTSGGVYKPFNTDNAVISGTDSVIYTTSSAHSFATGQVVKVSGLSDASFNITSDAIFDTNVTASNTFRVIKTISGTATGPGSVRLARNSITVLLPNSLIIGKTNDTLAISSTTLTRIQTNIYKTSTVNGFNVGDIVTVSGVTSSAPGAINITDQAIIAIENEKSGAVTYASNGSGNRFVVISSTTATYTSGGTSYTERIKNNITIEWGVVQPPSYVFPSRTGKIKRIQTVTYTGTNTLNLAVGDEILVSGTTNYNITSPATIKHLEGTTKFTVIYSAIAGSGSGTFTSGPVRFSKDLIRLAYTGSQLGQSTQVSSAATISRVPVVRYTLPNHNFIPDQEVTISGMVPSDYNITSQKIFKVLDATTSKKIVVKDIDYVATSAGAVSTYGTASYPYPDNNGSFVLAASPGITTDGFPFVVYTNPNAVTDSAASASTKGASTRIKIEYNYNAKHGISEAKTKNGVRVGDTVKVYGTIKNGSVQSLSWSGSVVTAYSLGSLNGLSRGDKVKISGAGSNHDGYFTVTDIGEVTVLGASQEFFKYTNSRVTSGGPLVQTPNPSWAVWFDNAADDNSAIPIESAERDAAGIVTIITTDPHGIAAGQKINVSISSGDQKDQISGTQKVLSVVSSTEFTYQTSYTGSAVAINFVIGFVYLRDGYAVYSVPNESTIYTRWNGTQSVKARSVTASINPRILVSDVIIVSDTANLDVNGQYRVVEIDGPDYFGDTTPSGGYFEAVPTGTAATSSVEVSGQGVFQKKQELSVGKRIEPINGRTLRSAMDAITSRTKGQFWVDPYKNLRYRRRKIENFVSNPVYEGTDGLASSSGWTLGNGFMLDRSGESGPYGVGYTVFTTGIARKWRYIKFVPTASRKSGGKNITVSKIRLYEDGVIIVPDGAESNYTESLSEGPENLLGDDLGLSWSTSKINAVNSSGAALDAPHVIISIADIAHVDTYEILSGNSSADEDPVSWSIYGSTNNSSWTLIDLKHQYSFPPARNASTGQIALADHGEVNFAITNGISVYPGRRYWVSARVKSSMSSSSQIKIGFASADGETIGDYVTVGGPILENEWKKIYSIVEVPSGKYKMYLSGHVSEQLAETHYTDWIATEISGLYGFSDHPSADKAIFSDVIDMQEYEIPDYSKESSGVANTVYIYAALMRPEDGSSENVIAVTDGRENITNTIDNGQIDHDLKRAEIATAQKSSGVVTIITESDHGFITNDYVIVTTGDSNFDGVYKVSVTSSTEFTYAKAGANLAAAPISGPATSTYGIRNWGASNCSISPSTDYELIGSHSILADPTSAGNIDITYSEGSSLSIRPGDSYTFSVKTFAPAGQAPRKYDMYLYYYGTGSNPQIVGQMSALDISDSPGSWKTISVSGVAPTTASYATFKITVKECAEADLHYFDDASFVDVSYQQIYSYSFTDTKAIWNASGKIIEAAESDASIATEEEVVLKAKSIFEGNPSGLESISFAISYNEIPPEIGTTVPFFWRNINIADVYVVKSVTTELIGKEAFYNVQITGDSELLGRGLLSGRRTAIAISNTVDAGTRTINPVIYPYIRNNVGGGIQINWLHAAGGNNVEYAVWARAIPIGSTQYDVARYKIIQSKIPSQSVDRTGGLIQWVNGSSYSDGTIDRKGVFNFKDFDSRYSYQFVIRASIINEEIYSPATYIPEPGSPISTYIIPPSSITIQTVSQANLSQDDYSEYVLSGVEEGMSPGVQSIRSVGADGGDGAVFSIDGRGIRIYNAEEYTDGRGVTHEAGSRTILESDLDNGVTINADVINTGVLNANVVDVINLNANNIVAGTIDASQIQVINLNADNITSGTITAEQIVVGSGANTAGISPSYLSGSAGYAFWAGTETPSSASPFSIQTDGSVIASNITIVGGSLDASIVNVTNLAADQVIVGSGDQTAGISSNYLSGTAGYAFWAGSPTPGTFSPFSVTTDGQVVASKILVQGDDSFIDGSIIKAGEIDAETVTIKNIDAGIIKAGNIEFSSESNELSKITFYYPGREQKAATWDVNGLVLNDPDTYSQENGYSSKRVEISDGRILLISNGKTTGALDGDGINATVITEGALPGGSNIIPNASFEIADYNLTNTIVKDTTALLAGWVSISTISPQNVSAASNRVQIESFGY